MLPAGRQLVNTAGKISNLGMEVEIVELWRLIV